MSRVLCITGMHRSGTSLTASWLQRCGVMIDDGELYGPGPGNPHGHFEDVQFVDLHRRFLLQRAPRSHGWILTTTVPFPLDEAWRSAARRMISRRDARYVCWGWKDPRSVLFLETWKALIPGLKVLLLWRPCHDVVHSLLRRKHQTRSRDYQIGCLRAIRTWRTYNQHLLSYRRRYGGESILVSIYDLVRGDRKVLQLINERFQLSLQQQSVHAVYDRKMLQAAPRNWFMRTIGSVLGVDSLERVLHAEADPLSCIPNDDTGTV